MDYAMKSRRSGEERIRVLVLSDHPVLGRGLTELIRAEEGFQTGPALTTVDEAVAAIGMQEPHAVLIDLSPPTRFNWSTLRDLHEFWPDLPLLVFSTQEEAVYAERALRSGARGYLMEQAGKSVTKAIQTILNGHVFLSPAMSEQIVESIASSRRKRPTGMVESLTQREIEILRMIGDGRDTKQIADCLQLSMNTVAVHRSNIKKKLKLSTANELVVFAVKWSEIKPAPESGIAPP